MSSALSDRTTFDYVIVGSGAAGSILANRLSEDGAHSVCVLEAGPWDRHPYLHLPAGFIKVIDDPRLSWQYFTEPHSNTQGRSIPIPQGRVLGGSTSINGLVYTRGQAEDFDHWAALGNVGWSHADVLPYFIRNERREGAASPLRGTDGPQVVSDVAWRHPVCERFIAGAQALGLPFNPDYNGATQEGVGYFQRTIRGRWRASAAGAYLHPARGRRNLHIETDAQAIAIELEGAVAQGVRFVRRGNAAVQHTVLARREVIVCAGALNTPKLLQLSGIGPAGALQALGIPVLHHLAGVGANLSDHFSVRLVAGLRGTVTINELARWPRLAGEALRWMAGRPSVLNLSPSVVHWFARSKAGLTRPDLQGVFTPASYRQGYVGRLDAIPGMTCGVWQHRPHSRGTVRLRSNHVQDDPIVQPNYLADAEDRATLVRGMRLARKLLGSAALASLYTQETLPGESVQSDDELLDFARSIGVSSYHVNGTARMGPGDDAMSVVDPELRVHGLDRLRVVDASVMPCIVSANTSATTMMIAEKAADMIRARPALQALRVDAGEAHPPTYLTKIQ